MIGFFVAKRVYKPYLIVPLFLYACVMYRILEGMCNNEKRNKVKPIPGSSSINVNYANDGLKGNLSSSFITLAKEYQGIERQRKSIISSMHHLIYDSTDGHASSGLYQGLSQQLIDHFRIKSYSDSNQNSIGKYTIKSPEYIVTCQNIQEVRLITKIGHGVSKQTFKAEFNGLPIAVKMVTRHQSEVKSCIENLNHSDPDINVHRSRCFVFSTMKLMKEILLSQQLKHPGLVRLLGYCIRNEESDTTDLNERGIVSVYELGTRVMVYNIQTSSWQQRLKHAIELADFLHYLEYSPLGSLRVRDFKEDHFVLVNGSLKMIDLDDVDNLEPSCSVYVSIESQNEMAMRGKSTGCEFHLPCQKGMCIGFNAKQNMKMMNTLFFKHLLFPTVFPDEVASEVGALLADLDRDLLTAAMMLDRLITARDMSIYLNV